MSATCLHGWRLKQAVLALLLWIGLLPGTTAAQPYRLIVTDLEGLEQVQREFGAFRDLLAEKAGVALEFYPVTSRTAAVEAVRAKKVDFVLTGPAEYVVMRTLTQCYPIIGFSRPDYYAAVMVRADSGINSVKDLQGKKVAMISILFATTKRPPFCSSSLSWS